jgi:uncharacterized protein
MTPRNLLQQLHADIDARASAVRSDHPEWLCGKGCDGCCQRLAEVPQLTATEWALLREGLQTLPVAQLAEIRHKVAALAAHSPRPVVCPLLDAQSGACPVYAQRPVACRTYGFYVQRELGLYCRAIETQVADGLLGSVVWGNHDAVDRRLDMLGERRALTEWFDL